MKKAKRPRSSKYDEPIKIDATPEEVARSLFNGKLKKEWRFMKEQSAKKVD